VFFFFFVKMSYIIEVRWLCIVDKLQRIEKMIKRLRHVIFEKRVRSLVLVASVDRIIQDGRDTTRAISL